MLLRHAVGLLAVGACGLTLAVVAFGAPPQGGGTGPPTWVPGPPPCHGHSACPPPVTSTVTNATTTTVARTSTATTTVATTTTVAHTSTVSTTTTVAHTSTVSTTSTVAATTTVSHTSTLEFGVPAGPSGPPAGADIWVAVKAPAANVFAGTQVTYTATVMNEGPSSATGVNLSVVHDGSRVLSSSAGDLGELDAGASTTATVTLVPNAAGTMSATFVAHADQADPQPGNNVEVISTPVLAGHAGPPGLQTPTQGAFTPPLLAVRKGHAWLVTTKVHVDEAAAMTVRIVDSSGKTQTMLPGTLVDWLPAMRPHASIPHVLTGAGWMPLKLEFGGTAGRRYSVVVQAIGPDGSVGSTSIGFRTP